MSKIELEMTRNGKVSLTLASHGHHVIRIPVPDTTPYRGVKRARAWRVVSLMDGLTVQEGKDILAKLEYNIQGSNRRPLGWIVDAVTDGHAEIHEGTSD